MKKIKSFLFTKYLATITIVVFLFNIISCSYFQTKNINPQYIPNINDIGQMHKYFVVHSRNKIFTVRNITVDENYLYGDFDNTDRHIYYYEGRPDKVSSHERDIYHEVHIYLSYKEERVSPKTEKISIKNINEVKIIEANTGKTAGAYIFGTIGVGLGVFIIVSIVVLMLKTSCPYVYVSEGDGYIFEGEIYGGAIAKNLVRDDYMPLPSLRVDKNAYRLRISNELKERQYTDLAELMVINHDRDKKVLLDKSGNPHLLGNSFEPTTAISYNGTDIRTSLNRTDKDVFFFNDTEHSKNGVLMRFDKPEDINVAKLVINGKNTLWFDYLFGEFLKKFGGKYNSWMEKQSNIPSEKRIQGMLDSDIPLSIYIKKNNDWELVDYLYTIGPLAARDFVIPLDLADLSEDNIEIKVETGFMFWELDHVAIDYTADVEFVIKTVKPTSAFGTGSKDWTSALSNSDQQYMIQEHSGEVTEVLYEVPLMTENKSRSIFLHTRGYYELIREYEGSPKISELNKFKEPGYFSDWSRKRYLMFYNREEEIASVGPNQ